MTFITDTRNSGLTFAQRFANLYKNVLEARAQRKVYVTTRNELANMTDRELADFGVTRGDIRNISYEAAYGKK